jgi:hypothetical protein
MRHSWLFAYPSAFDVTGIHSMVQCAQLDMRWCHTAKLVSGPSSGERCQGKGRYGSTKYIRREGLCRSQKYLLEC